MRSADTNIFFRARETMCDFAPNSDFRVISSSLLSRERSRKRISPFSSREVEASGDKRGEEEVEEEEQEEEEEKEEKEKEKEKKRKRKRRRRRKIRRRRRRRI